MCVIFAAHYERLLAVAGHRVRGQRDHRDLPRRIVGQPAFRVRGAILAPFA
jgi:hypothetical protein